MIVCLLWFILLLTYVLATAETSEKGLAMNTPSISFELLPLAMMLRNGSGTDFGASQCIPMGPCRLTQCLMLHLTLGVVMPLVGMNQHYGMLQYSADILYCHIQRWYFVSIVHHFPHVQSWGHFHLGFHCAPFSYLIQFMWYLSGKLLLRIAT